MVSSDAMIGAAQMFIGDRAVGGGAPVYVIAEISANHNQQLERAIELIHLASQSGADAVKFQTYTPDTITLDASRDEFRIRAGTVWDGRTLYDLYREAYTPWDWFPALAREAASAGIQF